MPDGGKRASLVSYNWGNAAGSGSPAHAGSAIAAERGSFAEVFRPGGVFSPGSPLAPVERERLRVWDFPVGANVNYAPRAGETTGFAELRALADNHDITRLAIETRKDQIEKLDWVIKLRDGVEPGADAHGRIRRLTAFWRSPDGEQPFATWLREALEDLLVLDAPAFEIRRNRGGDLIGLDGVDGATIKVLIDDTGRRPRPPAPAYEQVIHGRPWRLLTSDELVYLPRNRRSHKAYGFSPVEQIVMTVNIGLRRQLMQLQHFTEGNVPLGLMNAPDNWNAEQIRQFQEWFDAILAGNTAQRTRLIWGPAGARYQPLKEAPHKDAFDEWLARVVCYAFSLPPTAFTGQVNRATAETAQQAAVAEGLAPLMRWVKRFADHVIQDRMGEADLEFAWIEERPADPAEQAKMLDLYVRGGIYTVNEARAVLGFDAVPGGDRAMVYGSAGATPLAPAAPASAKRSALAPPLGKAKLNPDRPGLAAGSPEGGDWLGAEGNSEPSWPASRSGRHISHPPLGKTDQITFGHGGRHVADPEAVESAIRAALSGSILSLGLNTGAVNVGGTWYTYRAFLLPDGRIHVGTYYPR